MLRISKLFNVGGFELKGVASSVINKKGIGFVASIQNKQVQLPTISNLKAH